MQLVYKILYQVSRKSDNSTSDSILPEVFDRIYIA